MRSACVVVIGAQATLRPDNLARVMKQVVLRGGQPTVAEHPAPSPAPGRVLVATAASVISSGTERTAVASGGGGGSLPARAIRNPELIRAGLAHLREHGLRRTLDVARGATAPDSPLGYSCAGTVVDTGGVGRFRPGQPVACAGAGFANHAEFVSVPANLVAPVPEPVPIEHAAFTTLGAIAMQGVRRAEPTLGERVVVIGLGLLGQLTVQILRAAGCRVLGMEPIEARRALAEELGAERAAAAGDAEAVRTWTEGLGADAVIITASSPSNSIVNEAIELLRRKGRVVAVGDIGLGLERPPLYRREADVLISTSYGPGRYDPTYEEQGVDYPFEYVRWTEGRNMEAFLQLLASGDVRVEPLVASTIPVERADEAYAQIASESPPLAVVLTYDAEATRRPEVIRAGPAVAGAKGGLTVAVIGAGGFAQGVHLPNLKAAEGVRVKAIVTRGGTTASDVARQLGGAEAATDWRPVVEDPEVDLVLIATRHDTHAEIAAAALRAGKSVFVEKPLGLTREQIDEVWAAALENPRMAIGFNRPFAPLARTLGEEVGDADGPLQLIYRVNAPLGRDHWLNDPAQGGGRVQGEACHMYDFANWLCGTPVRVAAAALPTSPGMVTPESTSVTIEYAAGSVATVVYSGAGAPSMPKERVEVLRGGRAWVLDDFISLTSYGPDGERSSGSREPDKGHGALLAGVLAAARGKGAFEPGIEAAYAAQSVALAALEALATGGSIQVELPARRP
jgi:predicted dehydrogenase/threonine dehydrogenase-like Zn-dependent dehydrogenase